MSKKFQKLTPTAIRALSPGQKLTEHGITAERTARGDIRFEIATMVDRERIHRVIGLQSEGVTRLSCEKAIEAYKTQAREGRLDLPSGRKTQMSFQEAAEEYLSRIEIHPRHGRNLSAKSRHLKANLIPFFRSRRLNGLSDLTVSQYAKKRLGDGVCAATVNREVSTLSHFLNRAIEWKWLRADQKPRLAKSPETRKQIVVLEPSDQRALMRAAVEDQDPLTWMFVSIAMDTGMRHGEILRIRWENINFEMRRIHIGKAKAGQREQPISGELASVLSKVHKQKGEESGWLFPTTRSDAKLPHRQSMAGQFRRTVKRAGLLPSQVTPHVLRHTTITGLIRANVDLPTVQKISGHKTMAMVLRYTHLSDTHVDAAMSKLDGSFLGAITRELH